MIVNYSLRLSSALFFYAFLMVGATIFIVVYAILHHSPHTKAVLFLFILYAVVALLLLLTAGITAVLYARIMNTHYFFFVGALLSAAPLMALRSLFLLLSNASSPTILEILPRTFSSLYIITSLYLFFSVLFFEKKYVKNATLFLSVIIVALLVGTHGTLISTETTQPLHVGGSTIFTSTSIAFYTVIILLYFFVSPHTPTQKRLVIPHFFSLAGLIISLPILCLNTHFFMITTSGAILSICLILYIRSRFIRLL